VSRSAVGSLSSFRPPSKRAGGMGAGEQRGTLERGFPKGWLCVAAGQDAARGVWASYTQLHGWFFRSTDFFSVCR
jgi:hypothetical protein